MTEQTLLYIVLGLAAGIAILAIVLLVKNANLEKELRQIRKDTQDTIQLSLNTPKRTKLLKLLLLKFIVQSTALC